MQGLDRVKWNQHYDSMQWTAITVFTGVVALLFGYSYTKEFAPGPGYFFMGWWFTSLTLWITASFREFRGELTLGMTDAETCKFLTNDSGQRKLTQWYPFLLTYLLLDLAWLYRLWKLVGPLPAIAMAATATVLTPVLFYFVCRGGRLVKYKETIPGKAAGLPAESRN